MPKRTDVLLALYDWRGLPGSGDREHDRAAGRAERGVDEVRRGDVQVHLVGAAPLDAVHSRAPAAGRISTN